MSVKNGYALGGDKRVYRKDVEQWNNALFLLIAILLFMGGFVMEATASSHVRTRALFHEWGHILAAYSSGGWAYLKNWTTTGFYGGNSNWIKVWGPLGGVVLPTILWVIFVKLKVPVVGAILFGMAHGEIIYNYRWVDYEVYSSAWSPLFYFSGIIIALAFGWFALYRYAIKLGGRYVRKEKTVRRYSTVSTRQRSRSRPAVD